MNITDLKEGGALVSLIELLERAKVGTSAHYPLLIEFKGDKVEIPSGFEWDLIFAMSRSAYARLDALGVQRPDPTPQTAQR